MYLWILTELTGALSNPAPQEDPGVQQIHSVTQAGILSAWNESNLSMGQPQVPDTIWLSDTTEVDSERTTTMSLLTNIFEESVVV